MMDLACLSHVVPFLGEGRQGGERGKEREGVMMQEPTVEVEELVVAGLGSELLGVNHGLLEGVGLGRRGHFCWSVAKTRERWCLGGRKWSRGGRFVSCW